MQGKILIVDAIATNRIVLKVKLASAFYDVSQAASCAEAVEMARAEAPDLVISALDLPDGTAAGLHNRLRAGPGAEHVPVMAISSAADMNRRLETLRAGVLDVLARPINDVFLLGRVRSLIRASNASAEWRMRHTGARVSGLAEGPAQFETPGNYVIVSDQHALTQSWALQLRPLLRARLSHAGPAAALRDVRDTDVPDAFVIVLPADPGVARATLGLISTLRANGRTRHVGVVVLQIAPDPTLAANALDLGADDVMIDGFEPRELTLRLKALLRRKRQDASLREAVATQAKAAVFDPLTGLHNRRYAMPDLQRVAEGAYDSDTPFAVLVADLDHFKQINDLYGHAAGDAVLVEVAKRLRRAVRGTDMVARIGGEEFLIVMPETAPQEARAAALRICTEISGTPFAVPGRTDPIVVTISIGMAIGDVTRGPGNMIRKTGTCLLDQADKALYSAKMRGRNRVTLSRPAA